MKYFKNISTLEELRKQYKELLKKFHPDNANGSTEATQEINAEYDQLFKMLKDKHDSKSIEIIGNWIWAFDSYGYRAELKALGFRYARNKKAWYYHTEAFRKKSHKSLSMDDIRSYHGSTEVETDGMKRLKQA